MPDYDKLIILLKELVDEWELHEGAYYNAEGDIFGQCARELKNVIKPYEF